MKTGLFPLLNYLLTYPMEQSSSWEPNRASTSPAFYGTRRFITAFTCPYPEPDRSSPYTHIPFSE